MERSRIPVPVSNLSSQITTIQRQRIRQEPLILRLKPLETEKKEEELHVSWDESVIDNEHLGRKKSNCCCIFVPPREWDKPETHKRNEHETEHCRGHTEPQPPENNNEPLDGE
uniref:E3 ubiquitin-protein ligase PPP1R11 n=1 Tax=Parastrongyloides trichosuri TaxID=131310 RepID=A0A0N4ZX12_PARTI